MLFMKLLPADVQKTIKRLRFKRELQKYLVNANDLWFNQDTYVKIPPGDFTEKFDKFSPLAVYTMWLTADKKSIIEKINQYVLEWRKIHPVTSGDDLKEIGIPTGPVYRSILSQLRIAWINGDISNRQEEQKQLKEILSKIT